MTHKPRNGWRSWARVVGPLAVVLILGVWAFENLPFGEAAVVLGLVGDVILIVIVAYSALSQRE